MPLLYHVAFGPTVLNLDRSYKNHCIWSYMLDPHPHLIMVLAYVWFTDYYQPLFWVSISYFWFSLLAYPGGPKFWLAEVTYN